MQTGVLLPVVSFSLKRCRAFGHCKLMIQGCLCHSMGLMYLIEKSNNNKQITAVRKKVSSKCKQH